MFKKHLNLMKHVHRFIKRYINRGCDFSVECYSIFLIAAIITQRLFDYYEVDLIIPKLEPFTRQTDECELGYNLTWMLCYADKRLFQTLGWQYREVTGITDGIEQRHIDRCIENIADSNEKEFQLIRNIISRFDRAGDYMDYFAILFYPHLDDMGEWLEQERHKDLLSIFELCRQNIEGLIVNCFIGYDLFSVNGNVYIPIVLGECEGECFFTMDSTYLDVSVFFDLYMLHQVYELAVRRGFNDNDKGRVAEVLPSVPNNRLELRISYEKWRQE